MSRTCRHISEAVHPNRRCRAAVHINHDMVLANHFLVEPRNVATRQEAYMLRVRSAGPRTSRGVVGVALSALAFGAIASCVSVATAAPHAQSAETLVISARQLPDLGKVLVNSKGFTLYMFVPDKHKRVTCVGTCAAVWPPLKLPAGAKLVAKGGVKASLLGSDPDPQGGRVATYDGWPLYTYVADSKPGMATGQALNLNGGLWYVLSTSGKLVTKKTRM